MTRILTESQKFRIKMILNENNYNEYSKDRKYHAIFKLIDDSNKQYLPKKAKAAEDKLIKLKIYNKDGTLSTKDRIIISYFVDTFG